MATRQNTQTHSNNLSAVAILWDFVGSCKVDQTALINQHDHRVNMKLEHWLIKMEKIPSAERKKTVCTGSFTIQNIYNIWSESSITEH